MNNSEFEKYIESTSVAMMRFAVAILHSQVDAQDVVSGVVERLWRERTKIQDNHKASAYAMSAVRNGCYDLIRFRRRRKYEPLDERMICKSVDTQSVERDEFVKYCIAKLPHKQREILHLKDIEGYTTAEIAEIFNIERSNVRMILSRARVALREIIIEQMGV